MASTFVQEGDVLTFTAPTGGVTAGTPLFVGGVFCVPKTTAAQTVSFDAYVDGVHALAKTDSQAWVEGQAIYWDVANAKCDVDSSLGPLIGFASQAIAVTGGLTTGYVSLLEGVTYGNVFNVRKRFSVAQVNAGATIVPAIAGRRYRLLDAATIAVGGAASQPFSILGTVTTSRKLVAQAAAQSTQSTVLRAGATGSTLLADGASFVQNDANTAITIAKDASDVATATSIDVLVTFAIDPA